MHGPIDAQVTKVTIALGSIFEDTCRSNVKCEPCGASSSEGRYLTSHPSPLASCPRPDLPRRRRPQLALQLCTRVCPLAGQQDLRQAKDHSRKRIGQPCKAKSECHTAGAA
ncbi:hypothetical protein HPB49_018270 [Dermacentor silvarum]|uniref:Uncharacterized protein n=1 Tax=Dermacentor silvarum TaxID=543639 RepID=A0ACB8DF26_DERSI|nr:hypothetical protein HPB49_018270 [Dermacentor silvarum]